MAVKGARQYDGQDITLKAENDLSSKQYYFVELSGDGQVDVCDGTTDVVLGVLQNKPETSQEARVRIKGHSKISANESLTAGNVVSTSADGQAAVVTPGTTTGVYMVGVVETGCGSAGDIASIVLTGPAYLAS
jgi:hypothetical protein